MQPENLLEGAACAEVFVRTWSLSGVWEAQCQWAVTVGGSSWQAGSWGLNPGGPPWNSL